MRKLGNVLKQFHGYIWVGGIAFVIDAGLLLLLVRFGLYYILANTLSFMMANVFNFFAAHYLVFHKKTRFPSVFRSYLAVLGISIAGLLLNNVVMYIAVEWMTCSIPAAKVVATIVVLLWNFGARKQWVYG